MKMFVTFTTIWLLIYRFLITKKKEMSNTSEDASRNAEPSFAPCPISSGIVYTFIHETFEGPYILPRKGADEDFKNIKRCFSSLGLNVMPPYIDYSAAEVLNVLRQASLSNFGDYDCLVVIIITHYEKYGCLMTKYGCYYENEVIDFFKGDKCIELITKPKIFLFQSSRCQELQTDSKRKSHTEADSSGEQVLFTLPTEANIVALRSCYEGGPSHRPKDSGSWVIQTLCEMLEGLTGDTPLEDALAAVLNKVAQNREKTSTQVDYKYLPEVTSTMTNLFSFKNPSLKPENGPLEFYKQYKYMGKIFIFNYNNVYSKSERKFLKRDGTDIDADSLESCFEDLGFEVIRENDLTKEEVFKTLLKAHDFAEDTCVAVVVLTHGIEGNLGTFDMPFSEEELYMPFSDKKQPDLVGKPKFYFLQVCRGDKVTGSVQVENNLISDLFEGPEKITTDNDVTADSSDIKFDGNAITLTGSSVLPIECEESRVIGGEGSAVGGRVETDAAPAVATDAGKALPQAQIKTMVEPLDEDDTLVFHSTYVGTPSHRNIILGSWFIKNLCEVLQSKTQPFSLVRALSEVQEKVAKNEGENIANTLHKQMPVISSTLTKSLIISVTPKPK